MVKRQPRRSHAVINSFETFAPYCNERLKAAAAQLVQQAHIRFDPERYKEPGEKLPNNTACIGPPFHDSILLQWLC